jgi:hypothetical protein
MSDPTLPNDPFDLDPDVDVVPGDPPVPITVWRTPSADPAGGMSPRLAARVLAAYSRRGDTVYDATADPTFAHAVVAAGRRPAVVGHRDAAAEPAALVVTGWPPAGGRIDPVIVLGALRRLLARAGVLVVLLTDPGNAAGQVDAGPLVRAAGQARLAYLQHIVAVHAPVSGDHVHTTGSEEPATPQGQRHPRVHTDLLVFTAAGLGRRG